MKNKIFSCSIILLMIITLKGCFNYKDINKVSFATSIIFDVAEDNKITIYVDSLKSYRSPNEDSEKGRRIIYKGQGVSLIDAMYDINLASSFEIDYSQNRAYIFTEKAATEGLDKFLNLIENNQKFKIKPDVYIYSGDIDELLDVTSNDEEYLGLYLESLADKREKNPRSINANINDYLNNSLMEEDSFIVGHIEIRKDALDKKIEIGGGAAIKENKLVDILDPKEAISYNMIMNNLQNGVLYTDNVQDGEGLLSFEILETNIQTNIELVDEEFDFIKNIQIKASLAESQSPFNMDRESIDLIKGNKEKEIQKNIEKLFNKYKEEKIDVFEIERLSTLKYPHLDVEDAITRTNLKVNVTIDFEGTGLMKNTY